MIEKLTKNFKSIFKYRNSLIFKNEYTNENDWLESLKTKDDVSIAQKDSAHLSKILELTKLDLEEFKKVIGDTNYYNMGNYPYNVNDFLTDLLDKNETFKNHIDLAIADLVRDGIFKNLNDKKIERILSLFSEINCIGNLVSGKPKFVISVNKDNEYKKDGRFDLVITKGNISYYFDVKRVNHRPIGKWDDEEVIKIENKLKDIIQAIIEKGAKEKIDRPLFVLIDASDWAFFETIENNVPKAGNAFDAIFEILKRFFDQNKDSMQDLKSIVGVGLFYSFIGVTKDKELASIFLHKEYTNKYHKFLNEKDQIIELNSLIFDKLKEEQEKIISKYGDSRFELL